MFRLVWFLFPASLAVGQAVVGFRLADSITLPGLVDSNSPAIRWQGRLVVFTSDSAAKRSEGPDLYHLEAPVAVKWVGAQISRWIEAAWVDDDETIYAWYHHEPGGVCPNLTSPVIGAAVSHDGGLTFEDLGIILKSGEPNNCAALNGFFAGGHGDFSVVPDRERKFFYFYFTSYTGREQGLGAARLPFSARAEPVGAVRKYFQGAWNEPGLEGRSTPFLEPETGWETDSPVAYWGPSLHYNTYLDAYVMLMSRTCCGPRWPQEGVYLSTNADIADPEGWSEPLKLFDGGEWYPSVIGESDSLAGDTMRLFIRGHSQFEMVFWFPPPDQIGAPGGGSRGLGTVGFDGLSRKRFTAGSPRPERR